MAKYKHPVSEMLSNCLGYPRRTEDNRLNTSLSEGKIGETIRLAIKSLEAGSSPSPPGCPEGYGLRPGRDVRKVAIQSVLDGNHYELLEAFDWARETHGAKYWDDRSLNRIPLSDTDRQFLKYLLGMAS